MKIVSAAQFWSIFSPSVDRPFFSNGDLRQGKPTGVSSCCITPKQHLSVVLQYSNTVKSMQTEPLARSCPNRNILKIPVFRDSPKEGETNISAGLSSAEVSPPCQRGCFNTQEQSVASQKPVLPVCKVPRICAAFQPSRLLLLCR